MIKIGRCPHCGNWYELKWDEFPPGGWAWKSSAECPGCGAVVCVEEECDVMDVLPLDDDDDFRW